MAQLTSTPRDATAPDRSFGIIDGSAGGEHAPELYRAVRTASTYPAGDISPALVEHYADTGYLAFRSVFNGEQLRGAADAIEDLVAGRNERFDNVMFERGAADQVQAVTPEQRLRLVRKLASFIHFDDRLNSLAHDPRLLAMVRTLLGDREPRLFQDMALLKPPRIGREKPWHQDKAYFNIAIDEPVVGVWIAIDDATLENGCMHLLEGGHHLGPRYHWKRRDWQTCATEMTGVDAVAAPLPPGGALLFDGLLPHGTPTNHSDIPRRALQFHYCATDAVWISEPDRLAVYGTEGKGVTC